MAPTQVEGSNTTVSSSVRSGPKRSKKKRNHPYVHNAQESLPGVQKIKSSLRQTRRLLAKANIAADVRVETERRLKALEGDLARAETAKKERTYAIKYHKVKFFERQKLVRKIKQAKRDITSAQGKEKEEIEGVLEGLRVDLNYVLHYPKTKKYISLFPPETRETQVDPISTTSDDNDQRLKVRALIRDQMEHGEISKQPETELEGGSRTAHYTPGHSRKAQGESVRKDAHTSSSAHHVTERDDFFGEDYSEGGSEASDHDAPEMEDSDQDK
ncbi:hypothetical protein AZE42_06726 [Rhizopogon vesiculosus]|uniref:rRNA-processing protein EFG1 n=1 Tax=Rhizopogon vesiculosus TaxID=180088 RepID=A0A1J8QL29_9AGAM|nr:hypothetical protein AZE42_06726 [Rhizopogon vesiculosus]